MPFIPEISASAVAALIGMNPHRMPHEVMYQVLRKNKAVKDHMVRLEQLHNLTSVDAAEGLSALPATIATPRLLLRPPTLDDAQAVFDRWASDSDTARYLTWVPATDVADDLIEAALQRGAPDNVTVIVGEVVEGILHADPVVLGAAADGDTHKRLPGVEIPAEPSAAQTPSPQTTKTGRVWVRAALVTSTVVIAALGSIIAWLSSQWYVGIYQPTQVVAVYQGIPVAGLSRIIEVSTLSVSTLPSFERSQVEGTISTSSLTEANSTIDQLTLRAAACRAAPTTPGCPS